MKNGISGYVCVRNAIELDYCIVEAICSMIPVCQEVVVCDGESTDGTLDLVKSIGDSRVRIVTYPWPNPKGNPHFWTEWLNFARGKLEYSFQLTLDADEVLDPISYDTIRSFKSIGRCGMFQRLNYWRDPFHLVPHNRACGEYVARLGPTSEYMPSDEPEPRVKPNVRTNAFAHSSLVIHHLGFLRKNEAFLKKSREVQTMFFNSVDSRITETEGTGKRWDDRDYFDGLPLREYHSTHPKLVQDWLLARGYSI